MAQAASEQQQQQRKLWLVLDLDQTLLHTGKLANLSLLDLLSIEKLAGHGTQLFAPSPSTLIKLRPFANAFLLAASRMFHLCVCTVGSRSYAQQMLSMLDPEGLLFKGCPMLCRENMVVCDGGKRMKFLDEFPSGPPHLSQVLILDDTPHVWPYHTYGANLIAIDPYTFFPSDLHSYTGSDALLRNSTFLDESIAYGPLANVLALLRQIHRAYSLDPLSDARELLRSCCTGSVGKGYRLLASPLANQAPFSFSSSSSAEPCKKLQRRPCKKQRLQDGWAQPISASPDPLSTFLCTQRMDCDPILS